MDTIAARTDRETNLKSQEFQLAEKVSLDCNSFKIWQDFYVGSVLAGKGSC